MWNLDIYRCVKTQRTYPHPTPWRKLKWTLIEWPDNGVWKVSYAGNPSLRIHADQLVLIPSGTRHRLEMHSRTAMLTNYTFISLAHPGCNDALGRLLSPMRLSGERAERIKSCINGIRKFWKHRDIASQSRRQRLSWELAEELLRHVDTRQLDIDFQIDPKITKVILHVSEHYHEDLDRQSLASLIHLSPTRFHYVFEAATGQAPMAYVNQVRLDKAQELLLATSWPLKRIAEACGFNNEHYFCRVFRKKRDCTPSEFRRSFSTKLGGEAENPHL